MFHTLVSHVTAVTWLGALHMQPEGSTKELQAFLGKTLVASKSVQLLGLACATQEPSAFGLVALASLTPSKLHNVGSN